MSKALREIVAEYQRRHPDRVTNADGSRLAPLVNARKRALLAPPVEAPVNLDHMNYVGECKLIFPIKLPSANKLFRRTKKAQMAFESGVFDEVRKSWHRQGAPRIRGAFTLAWVIIASTEQNDPTNLHISALKLVVDALKNCGCIENDSWRYHKPDHAPPDWQHNPLMDAVQVEIKAA